MLADIDGNITDTYTYDAFGNLINKTGETENNYLYCGEQYDGTTGYYYLRARYMNPQTGTFVTMDTYQGAINDPVSLHKYLYANANPVMNIDPTGNFTLMSLMASSVMHRDLQGVATINYTAVFQLINIAVTSYDLTKSITQAILTGENIGEVLWAIGVGIGTGLIINKACAIKKLAKLAPYVTATFSAIGFGTEAAAVIKAYESGDSEEFNIRVTQLTFSILSLVFSQCFTGETMIATEEGNKRIDEIQVGDFVWAYNFETGEKELHKVKEVFVNETDTLVRIIVNGEVINTTEGHPFYVKDKGWVLAGDLNVGDKVVLFNGNTSLIENIEIEKLDKPTQIYNFEVEGLHNYYAEGILVHNGCGTSSKYQKASWWERLTKTKANVDDLYANPLDEFSDPKIGPCESVVSKYINEIYTTGKLPAPIEVQKLSTGGYEIVNGHHRWLAAIKAGLKTVPIKIENYNN